MILSILLTEATPQYIIYTCRCVHTSMYLHANKYTPQTYTRLCKLINIHRKLINIHRKHKHVGNYGDKYGKSDGNNVVLSLVIISLHIQRSVAVCCCVLQCGAVWCSVVQCVAGKKRAKIRGKIWGEIGKNMKSVWPCPL